MPSSALIGFGVICLICIIIGVIYLAYRLNQMEQEEDRQEESDKQQRQHAQNVDRGRRGEENSSSGDHQQSKTMESPVVKGTVMKGPGMRCRCGSDKVVPSTCELCNETIVECSECFGRLSKCRCSDSALVQLQRMKQGKAGVGTLPGSGILDEASPGRGRYAHGVTRCSCRCEAMEIGVCRNCSKLSVKCQCCHKHQGISDCYCTSSRDAVQNATRLSNFQQIGGYGCAEVEAKIEPSQVSQPTICKDLSSIMSGIKNMQNQYCNNLADDPQSTIKMFTNCEPFQVRESGRDNKIKLLQEHLKKSMKTVGDLTDTLNKHVDFQEHCNNQSRKWRKPGNAQMMSAIDTITLEQEIKRRKVYRKSMLSAQSQEQSPSSVNGKHAKRTISHPITEDEELGPQIQIVRVISETLSEVDHEVDPKQIPLRQRKLRNRATESEGLMEIPELDEVSQPDMMSGLDTVSLEKEIKRRKSNRRYSQPDSQQKRQKVKVHGKHFHIDPERRKSRQIRV